MICNNQTTLDIREALNTGKLTNADLPISLRKQMAKNIIDGKSISDNCTVSVNDGLRLQYKIEGRDMPWNCCKIKNMSAVHLDHCINYVNERPQMYGNNSYWVEIFKKELKFRKPESIIERLRKAHIVKFVSSGICAGIRVSTEKCLQGDLFLTKESFSQFICELQELHNAMK